MQIHYSILQSYTHSWEVNFFTHHCNIRILFSMYQNRYLTTRNAAAATQAAQTCQARMQSIKFTFS